MRKNKISFIELLSYFIIFSFLFPRGYADFNLVYKNFFTGCVWISTIFIWLQFFLVYSKEIKKKNFLLIMCYFVFMIIITILFRGININGLQKLFAYPSIFIFIIFNIKSNPKRILNIINNIMLVLFLSNQFISRLFFSEQYHITFLGHVQMISQLGSLAIFCAVLYWLLYHNKKKRTILIIFLSLFTMFTTDASSANISATILCVFAILYKLKIYNYLTYNSKFYIIGGMILSVLIITLAVVNVTTYNNTISFLDFSGRGFIWSDALVKIKDSLLFGYGIEGVLLDVFWNQWTNPEGFNYAHNQIVQNFLDGGIVGFILFWLMIFTCFKNIKSIQNLKYRVLVNAIFIIFSFIMIFESTTLYCYMFIYLAIVYVLPLVINKVNNKVVK